MEKIEVETVGTVTSAKEINDETMQTFEVKASHTEVSDKEKSITHYISTTDLDRGGDIVDPKGMDDSEFGKSPSVWYNHEYVWNPHAMPIGKSLWRKRKDEGVLAKTQFANHDFASDILELHKGGFANTWSIGFRIPKDKKDAVLYDPQKEIRYINHWMLDEYSSAPIAMNPNALDTVKSLHLKSDFGKSLIVKAETELMVKASLDNFQKEINTIKEMIASLADTKNTDEFGRLSTRILIIENQLNKKITNEAMVSLAKASADIIGKAVRSELSRLTGRKL